MAYEETNTGKIYDIFNSIWVMLMNASLYIIK